MKFSTITPMNRVMIAGYILGAIAITLIALPMGVFAQEDAEIITDDVVTATTTSIEEVVVVPRVDPYYDDYKREQLPKQNNVYSDFVVGPGRFSLEIAPGESKTVILNVSNRLGGERLFRFTTEDMTANESQTATIQLLGDEVGPYTIKDYISVPYDRIYIENNERALVPVTISIPPDAEPGGFYGSILTEVMPEKSDEDEPGVAPSTALVSRIGTLFYVTTPGQVERSGELVDLTTIPKKSVYFSGPIDMGIVFENKGSVHLTPYGNITVTNLLGDPVGQVELDPWFVMPQSVRTREISWDREFLFGRYRVTADIERGYNSEVDTMSLTFWVIPWKFLVVVFGGLFLFFLILRFLLRNFEFKRK